MTVKYKESDKATDHLLDFIAGGVPTNKSGESAGCYDATFGDIDGSHYGDLSKKDFSGIYAMQTEMLNKNKISTATGRYQALKGTLQEYQKGRSILNTDMFTQEIQDDFGFKKMCDRGYKSWWKKQISDDEFMYRLSCEWASLPDPYNGGKSHYDGDSAGNHASTSLANFRAALTTARGFIEGAGDIDAEDIDDPVPVMDPDRGVRAIQTVLVETGDLSTLDEVDGMWGPKSETALRDLLRRDKN